jgi:hypothetical protein
MGYMLTVGPPMGGTTGMADLICGSRTVGMEATASASFSTPWTGPALMLAVILLAGAACSALTRVRAWGAPIAPEWDGQRTVALLRHLVSNRLALTVQAVMCLTMAAALVAMYR